MEDITNEQISKAFGLVFQEYRLKKNITQEKLAEILSKSTKTISQLENAKDGTSKKTDINLINTLDIEPNVLYQNFINSPRLKKKIELANKISDLSIEKIDSLIKIVDIIKNL